MNDLPEESKKIIYTCEDCKCYTCVENFANYAGVNCFNCISCENNNRHIEQCTAFYELKETT